MLHSTREEEAPPPIRKKRNGRTKVEERGMGKLDILPPFSLLDLLKPGRGVPWPNYIEPECLVAKSENGGVRQQKRTTLDVPLSHSQFSLDIIGYSLSIVYVFSILLV
jgi:hypothetical protein